MNINITHRHVPTRACLQLEQQGLPLLLARLFAARGITDRSELEYGLETLLPPQSLLGVEAAAGLLADAVTSGKQMLIVADYDCDGATACAVGVLALRTFGGSVHYLVPNRFEYGYGLTPEIARLAAQHNPDILITVDNGIASIDGVAEANRFGIACVITDHHLPGDALPAAAAIVNPNQPGCAFPSKSLAGVGVMFYVVMAVRAELRRRGWFKTNEWAEINLGDLLDLVALGTIADVVPLDHNNRVLVSRGLSRIRAGKMQPGVLALFRAAGRDPDAASTFDLGFALGPRLNAAGRLTDMALGIECLITDDPARALNIAQQLDTLNRERRTIEAGMQDEALLQLDDIDAENRASITLFDPDWHQGVIGILASRIKDRLHRPAFAFARGNEGELKGSGRSIPGLHLRDALDLVAKQNPGLLLHFGGHAAAAGVTLRETDFLEFEQAFEDVAGSLLTPADLTRNIITDGSLENGYISLESARLLQREIWGQGFPAPMFSDRFMVEKQRILKDKHLKLTLNKNGARFEAIQFNFAESAPGHIHAAYRLDINDYNGLQNVQLVLEHFEPA